MQQSKNAKDLRDLGAEESELIKASLVRNNIYLVLESVYDTYNIGGLFRLADALCVKGVYLTGETTVPPNHRIAKASNGTYKVTPWEYKENTIFAIEAIRKKEKKVMVVAVEQDETSINFVDIEIQKDTTVILIVGNETYGISKETLEKADIIAEIPMWGVNKSLNVIVSGAIVGYSLIKKIVSV